MKKIAFHIQKGGVGKTTLSGNIASYLACRLKTVLVDVDPQGNASSWLIHQQNVRHDLGDVLKGQVPLSKALVKVQDNLFVLPTFGLNSDLKQYAESTLADEPFIFEDLCEELAKLGFEMAIFDLSPGMSRLEKSVILAMDEVVTPLTPEYFSVDGITIFHQELAKINKGYRKQVSHTKLVCNSLNRSFKRHVEFYKEFQKLNYQLFTIAQDSKLAEAQIAHQAIFDYYPEAKSIEELKKLGDALCL